MCWGLERGGRLDCLLTTKKAGELMSATPQRMQLSKHTACNKYRKFSHL